MRGPNVCSDDGAGRPRSLVWATSLDVLPADRAIERHHDHWTVSVPSNPEYWWGNLLIFDSPPATGDRPRWEARFDAELGRSGVRHRTFAWDSIDGQAGEAESEFSAHGYELECTVGLIATLGELRRHPRENRSVHVAALDPDGDAQRWEQVVEVWAAEPPPGVDGEAHRSFSRRRLDGLRSLLSDGRGSWYVALDGDQVVASCGIVVTARRARYQAVDTIASHRRRGICSRLLLDAAQDAVRRHAIEHFVIAADAAYHAIGIYESLGFAPCERVYGVVHAPRDG